MAADIFAKIGDIKGESLDAGVHFKFDLKANKVG